MRSSAKLKPFDVHTYIYIYGGATPRFYNMPVCHPKGAETVIYNFCPPMLKTVGMSGGYANQPCCANWSSHYPGCRRQFQ